MRNKKHFLISLALSLFLLFSLFGCKGGSEGSNGDSLADHPAHMGLYITEDGTLMKDEKEFHGFGVNYYSMLNRAFSEKWNVDKSLTAMETLAENGVKVIRFNIAGYAYQDWDYVIKKEDKYFEVLDRLCAKAADLEIGLIPSFFWHISGLTDYFDEPAGSSLALPESKTCQFIVSFTEKVVKRYAHNEGIYGWEFGNELNLGMDTPKAYWNSHMSDLPAHSNRPGRNENDRITSAHYAAVLSLWSETVWDNDPYHRFIGTGDASMRQFAWHWANDNGSYTIDTQEQYNEMIDRINTKNVSAISYHSYADGSTSTVNYPEWLPDYMGTTSWEEQLGFMKAQGKRTKKTVYLGETGYVYANATMDEKNSFFTTEKILTVYKAIADAAVKTDFPLTLFWNYDDRSVYKESDPTDSGKNPGTEWSWNENWEKGKGIFQIIKEGNEAFAAKHSS